MTRRSSVILTSTLLPLVLVLSACSSSSNGTPAAPTNATGPSGSAVTPIDATVIQSNATVTSNEITFGILQEQLGYWKDQGLNVTTQTATGGGQAIQLLAAGQGDFALGNAVSVLAAQAQGTDITAVYNLLRQHATALVVLADGDIKEPKDLKGKTIGIFAEGSGRALDGRAMVQAAGLDPDADVSWLAVGAGPAAFAALESGQVQALSLWDTQYALMEDLGYKITRFTFPFQKDIFSALWMAPGSLVRDNPEAVVRFGRAQVMAETFARANPRAAATIYVDAYPDVVTGEVTREQAIESALKILETNLKNGEVSDGELPGSFGEGSWNTVQDYYVGLGLLESPIDVSKAYVPQALVEQMNDFDHEAVISQATNWGK